MPLCTDNRPAIWTIATNNEEVINEKVIVAIFKTESESQDTSEMVIRAVAIGRTFEIANIKHTTTYDWSAEIKGIFRIRLEHIYERVDFVDVRVPPQLQGIGLGTRVYQTLIEWAYPRATGYKIAPLLLGVVDALTAERKLTRNRFYKRIGFEIDSSDEGITGHAIANSFDDLYRNMKDRQSEGLAKQIEYKETDLCKYLKTQLHNIGSFETDKSCSRKEARNKRHADLRWRNGIKLIIKIVGIGIIAGAIVVAKTLN